MSSWPLCVTVCWNVGPGGSAASAQQGPPGAACPPPLGRRGSRTNLPSPGLPPSPADPEPLARPPLAAALPAPPAAKSPPPSSRHSQAQPPDPPSRPHHHPQQPFRPAFSPKSSAEVSDLGPPKGQRYPPPENYPQPPAARPTEPIFQKLGGPAHGRRMPLTTLDAVWDAFPGSQMQPALGQEYG